MVKQSYHTSKIYISNDVINLRNFELIYLAFFPALLAQKF